MRFKVKIKKDSNNKNEKIIIFISGINNNKEACFTTQTSLWKQTNGGYVESVPYGC